MEDPDDPMLLVVLRDMETGDLALSGYRSESMYTWSLGNWSCDCNRCIDFGLDHLAEDGCFSSRFPAVFVSGQFALEGFVSDLDEINQGYALHEVRPFYMSQEEGQEFIRKALEEEK